jgi:5'-nucleotidase
VLREKRPDGIVLLDGGDVFQGTLVVNMTEGEVVIKAYNLLEYDAVALGNHEFDYGPEGEPVVALTPADDPLGNIKKRVAQARFPFLAGNVFEKATGKPVQWPNLRRSALIERKGVRIGLIGLSTPMTPSVTLAQNVASLEFRELEQTTIELAAELRERGAQVVLLALHAGTGCPVGTGPHETQACDVRGELWRLLHEIPPGTVDAAVAGHTHQYLAHFVNGTPSIQSGSFGVAFGVVDLWFDRRAGRLDTSRTRIWPTVPLCRKVYPSTGDCRQEVKGEEPVPAIFLGEIVQPITAITDALRPELKLVEHRKNELLGPVLEDPFTRSRVDESDLGDFVADVMREALPGTHVAMTNSGGLRADLDSGPLTYGAVFSALPFENRLAQVTLTGDQLVELLRQGVSGKHGIVQVSGIRLEVLDASAKPCRPEEGRLVTAIFDDGRPIVADATYEVVMNDFMATGGDGFQAVLSKLDPDQIRVRHDLPPLREVVVSHLRVHPQIKGPTRGPRRIRFVTPRCE